MLRSRPGLRALASLVMTCAAASAQEATFRSVSQGDRAPLDCAAFTAPGEVSFVRWEDLQRAGLADWEPARRLGPGDLLVGVALGDQPSGTQVTVERAERVAVSGGFELLVRYRTRAGAGPGSVRPHHFIAVRLGAHETPRLVRFHREASPDPAAGTFGTLTHRLSTFINCQGELNRRVEVLGDGRVRMEVTLHDQPPRRLAGRLTPRERQELDAALRAASLPREPLAAGASESEREQLILRITGGELDGVNVHIGSRARVQEAEARYAAILAALGYIERRLAAGPPPQGFALDLTIASTAHDRSFFVHRQVSLFADGSVAVRVGRRAAPLNGQATPDELARLRVALVEAELERVPPAPPGDYDEWPDTGRKVRLVIDWRGERRVIDGPLRRYRGPHGEVIEALEAIAQRLGALDERVRVVGRVQEAPFVYLEGRTITLESGGRTIPVAYGIDAYHLGRHFVGEEVTVEGVFSGERLYIERVVNPERVRREPVAVQVRGRTISIGRPGAALMEASGEPLLALRKLDGARVLADAWLLRTPAGVRAVVDALWGVTTRDVSAPVVGETLSRWPFKAGAAVRVVDVGRPPFRRLQVHHGGSGDVERPEVNDHRRAWFCEDEVELRLDRPATAPSDTDGLNGVLGTIGSPGS